VEQQSLYERLGGVNAIAMVVDRFSDAIVENPKLQRNPALAEWNESGQLAGLKFMRTLWLCQEAGGPFQYTGKELGEAHKDLHITSDEFDEVGAEIASALDHFKCAGARKGGSLGGHRRSEGRGRQFPVGADLLF
jgi:hemoglobin